jgi:cobaltochelatase CobS
MTDNETKAERAHTLNISATEADGVKCMLDEIWVHSIEPYLKRVHPEVTLADYRERFPDAPLMSERVQKAAKIKAGMTLDMATSTSANVVPLHGTPHDAVVHPAVSKKSFADVFELGDAPAAQNAKGAPIMIEVLGDCGPELSDYIPSVDPNYIYDIENLKAVMMAVAIKTPLLAWGMHGTGKTTLLLQYAARTNRPAIRVQHTISTEESHVLGQYVVRNGDTMFEPGPLAYAMRYGLIYIADEYDFALPSVTSVYQPVLEGHRLIIKEAPPEWRVVKPHPNFRFFATGNTNGGGDETGLYQGTQMQNAANYSRFGITIEISYMPEKQEIAVLQGQCQIFETAAKKLVDFGNNVRTAYQDGTIGVTVSPRELINAGIIGRALGAKWTKGLELAYTNRLNKNDRAAVMNIVQRIFGS